jgi:hypothetical protein
MIVFGDCFKLLKAGFFPDWLVINYLIHELLLSLFGHYRASFLDCIPKIPYFIVKNAIRNLSDHLNLRSIEFTPKLRDLYCFFQGILIFIVTVLLGEDYGQTN